MIMTMGEYGSKLGCRTRLNMFEPTDLVILFTRSTKRIDDFDGVG